MVVFECTGCHELTSHLIIFKGKVQYWRCEKCGCSDTPVLTTFDEMRKHGK